MGLSEGGANHSEFEATHSVENAVPDRITNRTVVRTNAMNLNRSLEPRSRSPNTSAVRHLHFAVSLYPDLARCGF